MSQDPNYLSMARIVLSSNGRKIVTIRDSFGGVVYVFKASEGIGLVYCANSPYDIAISRHVWASDFAHEIQQAFELMGPGAKISIE
jgi:hypothetical protein